MILSDGLNMWNSVVSKPNSWARLSALAIFPFSKTWGDLCDQNVHLA